MRLSIYTSVKDGIYYDYHVVAMLKHHLPLADEIIVNDGYSTDSTYEQITKLDPKIQVFRSKWGKPNNGLDWIQGFKNAARERCTGDWCILLDADEFIPEWEFCALRKRLEETNEVMLGTKMVNFYGNYKVYHSNPEKVIWPSWKMNIHRNIPEIEVWGDGSHVRHKSHPFGRNPSTEEFSLHHFGFVRNPARLRQKWNFLHYLYRKKRRWLSIPSFLFDWMPYDWKDPKFLPELRIYDGPFVRAVREDPQEFVRDKFSMYELLRRERQPS